MDNSATRHMPQQSTQSVYWANWSQLFHLLRYVLTTLTVICQMSRSSLGADHHKRPLVCQAVPASIPKQICFSWLVVCRTREISGWEIWLGQTPRIPSRLLRWSRASFSFLPLVCLEDFTLNGVWTLRRGRAGRSLRGTCSWMLFWGRAGLLPCISFGCKPR